MPSTPVASRSSRVIRPSLGFSCIRMPPSLLPTPGLPPPSTSPPLLPVALPGRRSDGETWKPAAQCKSTSSSPAHLSILEDFALPCYGLLEYVKMNFRVFHISYVTDDRRHTASFQMNMSSTPPSPPHPPPSLEIKPRTKRRHEERKGNHWMVLQYFGPSLGEFMRRKSPVRSGRTSQDQGHGDDEGDTARVGGPSPPGGWKRRRMGRRRWHGTRRMEGNRQRG